MKPAMHVLLSALMLCVYSITGTTNPKNNPELDELNKSGYAYTVNVTKINSKYSEIASSIFRDKLIIVSSKKIGGLGNGIDNYTNEPFTDLFCMDVKQDGELSYPILFSRILNTKDNEGQVAFSKDEHTIYYTRSSRANSANYKLYMAQLEEGSYGNWINEIELIVSSEDYSIENPHVSHDGKYLYFASNMIGGFGGFDLYKAPLHEDGSIGEPINLGSNINTAYDEKYPHTTLNGTELYFSSKGHNSIGGYDIFVANKNRDGFYKPRNLGLAMNSKSDEIGFLMLNNNEGVFSSNKDNESGSFNLYKFQSETIYQDLQGIVIDEAGKIVTNSTILLLDNEDKVIERQVIGEDASYNFKIKAYKDYKLKVLKAGFHDYVLEFQSERLDNDMAFKAVVQLIAK